jgi:hypothetical protein
MVNEDTIEGDAFGMKYHTKNGDGKPNKKAVYKGGGKYVIT